MKSCEVMPQSAIPRFNQKGFTFCLVMMFGNFVVAIGFVVVSAKILNLVAIPGPTHEKPSQQSSVA